MTGRTEKPLVELSDSNRASAIHIRNGESLSLAFRTELWGVTPFAFLDLLGVVPMESAWRGRAYLPSKSHGDYWLLLREDNWPKKNPPAQFPSADHQAVYSACRGYVSLEKTRDRH